MTTHLKIHDGLITRHDRIDHAEGDKVRRFNRDLVSQGKRRDGNSPFNEAFSFTHDEYELLKKIKPHLFDQSLDPKTRRQHWIDFGNSTEGRCFRVR